MYTINLATGLVTRDSDGHVVAPAQSTTDTDYIAYVDWINLGNSPTETTIEIPTAGSRITRLAFRNRFTTMEKVSLDMASIDNPAGTTQARQMAAMIRVYLKDLDNASFVDLSRADTIAGVQQLAAVGLIGSGRPAEILSLVIHPDEVPS